jgi:lysophospholipase L1-like esterase
MPDGAYSLDRRSKPRALACAFAGAVIVAAAAPALAQPDNRPGTPIPALKKSAALAPVSPSMGNYSTECSITKPAFENKIALRRSSRALREKRALKVLAVGSSSTVGLGASSPDRSYTVRLESNLEGRYKGADIKIITRGVNGEIAEEAAERLKLEVATLRPDLVIWQVGTNDALARIEQDHFADELQSTVKWLLRNRIDVILIDPQYVETLAKDRHFNGIVNAIGEVGKSERVMVVRRFGAMAELAKLNKNRAYVSSDRLHLNDAGYGCMAEYAARAIFSGVAQVPAVTNNANNTSNTNSSGAIPAVNPKQVP